MQIYSTPARRGLQRRWCLIRAGGDEVCLSVLQGHAAADQRRLRPSAIGSFYGGNGGSNFEEDSETGHQRGLRPQTIGFREDVVSKSCRKGFCSVLYAHSGGVLRMVRLDFLWRSAECSTPCRRRRYHSRHASGAGRPGGCRGTGIQTGGQGSRRNPLVDPERTLYRPGKAGFGGHASFGRL